MMAMSFTTEQQALIDSVGLTSEVVQSAQSLRFSSAGFDWLTFMTLARRHGVAPRAFRHATSLYNEAVPKDVADAMRQARHRGAFRALFMARELHALLDLYREHGIRAIPLKGPVVAQEAYGDLAARQMGDLDILVSPDDARRATDALCDRGYQTTVNLTGRWERSYLAHQHHYKCYRSDGEVREVHWALATRAFAFPAEFDDLWSRRRMVTLAGSDVPTLGATDLILSLTLHGTTHCWTRLSWICDVAELIRKDVGFDWSEVRAAAVSRGLARALGVVLIVIRDLLTISIPDELRQLTSDHTAKTIAAGVITRMFGDTGYFSDSAAGGYFHLLVRERWADRMKYVAFNDRVTPHPCDRDFLPLPDWCYPLYYAIKPIRLVSSAVGQCFQAVNRRPSNTDPGALAEQVGSEPAS